MVVLKIYPRAKLNWTLNVTGERPDGYHDLDMLMQSVELCDEMTIDPADELTLEVANVTGDPIPSGADNIVLKAAEALRAAMGDAAGVSKSAAKGARIRLVKRIPAQAGLGGGSSDAAAALRALNIMWDARMDAAQLSEIGMSVGADVPYCLAGGLARVTGRGEAVEPLPGAPELRVLIVKPEAGLSTGQVFSRCGVGEIQPTAEAARRLAALDFEWLRANTRNDLEPPALELQPVIAECIAALYANGARFARMTGSGSAVFGVFDGGAIEAALCDPRISRHKYFMTRTLTERAERICV